MMDLSRRVRGVSNGEAESIINHRKTRGPSFDGEDLRLYGHIQMVIKSRTELDH